VKGKENALKMSQRGQKTFVAVTEAWKSQGNSNKSATTFENNTVATCLYFHFPLSTFFYAYSARLSKVGLSRIFLCHSLDRHPITYAGNIRIKKEEQREP